ncbi:MAG: hypothetical protein IPH68_15135 [Chitinophagaceae bacterium]|nr:hypothetical protein [Chitinophagaceae bacterium]MBK7123993.1 hypothetical protein [Chitinophagaceae bacterium]MBK7559669.1 hypothetical protein [Chitinophagaceae bacterium]MBK9530189.1 hypothetical protein [Chitinophagaceae bacterium]HQW92051.1 hypothetical protein [Ferruginibacter sp.]
MLLIHTAIHFETIYFLRLTGKIQYSREDEKTVIHKPMAQTKTSPLFCTFAHHK